MAINVRDPGSLPNVFARVERARALLSDRKLDRDVREIVESLVALASTQHELNKRLWECLRGLPFGVLEAIEEAGGFPEDDESGLGSRRPSAHTHGPLDVVGLESDNAVLLASEVFAQRPHTHGTQDIVGLPDTPTLNTDLAHPKPHAHRVDEIAGLVGDTQVILASQVFGP